MQRQKFIGALSHHSHGHGHHNDNHHHGKKGNHHNHHHNHSSITIPVLFMTATFNSDYLRLLQKIVGFTFDDSCIFWSSRLHFNKRHIQIISESTKQKYNLIKRHTHLCLQNHINNKVIIYSNVAADVNHIRHEIDTLLNESSSPLVIRL